MDGCDKAPRSVYAEVCAMHYHRRYRHGDVAAVSTGVSVRAGGKYRLARVKDYPGLGHHPLMGPCGRVYLHRVVLYDKIGPGPHPCHWCGRSVDWMTGTENHPDMLTADHLDGHREHNKPENLVPACGKCNIGRAAAMRREALVGMGFWAKNDTIDRLRDPRQRRRDNTFAPRVDMQ